MTAPTIEKAAVFVLALNAVSAAVEGSEVKMQTITREMIAEDLAQMRETIDHVWAHTADKHRTLGVDVGTLYARSKSELTRAKDMPEMLGIFYAFIAGLEDGHSNLLPSPVMLMSMSAMPDPDRIPGLREVEDGIVVEKIPKSAPQVRKGDMLIRVNRKDTEEALATISRYVSASGAVARRHLAIQQLMLGEAVLNRGMDLEFRRPDGSAYSISVSVSPDRFSAAASASMNLSLGARDVRRLEDGVGYLRIPSFILNADWWKNDRTPLTVAEQMTPDRAVECWQTAVKWFDEAFVNLEKASAIIIDLRGNGGGNDLIASYLAQHLIAEDFLYYTLQRRYSPEWTTLCPDLPAVGWGPRWDHWVRSDKPFKFDLNVALLPRNPAIAVYRGPVVVLMDEGCASATTVWLNCLRHYRSDMRFIGRPAVSTLGGGNPIATLKNTQAKLGLSYCRGWDASGNLLEGLLVNPDIKVAWTRQDVVDGADPDLDAAKKVIGERLRTGKPWSKSDIEK